MSMSRAKRKKKESGKNKCNKKHTKTIRNSRIVLAFDFCFVLLKMEISCERFVFSKI
jgi:hypothetical protein